MAQGLSKDTILNTASAHPFYVDKYRYSQASLRKKCRRMCRDGLLRLIHADSHYLVYRTSRATPVAKDLSNAEVGTRA